MIKLREAFLPNQRFAKGAGLGLELRRSLQTF